MKKLLALALIAFALIFTPGCVLPKHVAPGADPLVVQAEQLAKDAPAVINDFIMFVDRNAAVLPKDVIAAADLAATSTPTYIRDLRKVTKAYKASRTPENKTAVQTKIDALRLLLEMVREYNTKQTT